MFFLRDKWVLTVFDGVQIIVGEVAAALQPLLVCLPSRTIEE